MRQFKILAFLSMLAFPLFSSPPSEFRAGVNISSHRLTGTATATLYLNNNTASYTKLIQGRASGTVTLEVEKAGILKINKITSMTGNHLKVGSDTAIAVKLPLFTTTQRNNIIPATSAMVIFNTSTARPQIYYGGSWNDFGHSSETSTLSAEFPSLIPMNDAFGGTVYIEEEAIGLNGSTTQGLIAGKLQIPANFDRTQDAYFNFHFSTPVTGTGFIVVQARYQIVGSGTAEFSPSGFTMATETIRILSSSLVRRHISSSTLKIPALTANPGDIIYHRLFRFPQNAGDTFNDKPIKVYNCGITFSSTN